MNFNFNRKQYIKALMKLEFKPSGTRNGKHDKFIIPEKYNHKIPPFIMIPRHKEIHCQREILNELKKINIDLYNEFLDIV